MGDNIFSAPLVERCNKTLIKLDYDMFFKNLRNYNPDFVIELMGVVPIQKHFSRQKFLVYAVLNGVDYKILNFLIESGANTSAFDNILAIIGS